MSPDFLSQQTDSIAHRELRVTGIVQGVGFRPFVYRLAHKLGLRGLVWNDSQGVGIRIQGGHDQIQAFDRGLRHDYPSAARVERVSQLILPPANYDGFHIAESLSNSQSATDVSPDMAICSDCRREFADASNRRHRHLFINCTQCGPRFTVIRHLPYDRPATTMDGFVMCDSCRTEYTNPLDRRFHAQPIACPNCGPQITFMPLDNDSTPAKGGSQGLDAAVELLLRKKILLLQGIGGFHLACDAECDDIVRELRRRKRREMKPLAVMFPDESTLCRWCDVSDFELDPLRSTRAPIVLVKKNEACPVAPSVAPDQPTLGAMLPYAPLHLGLLQKFGKPLVMTSANFSDEPILHEADRALGEMADVADGALYHDRPIEIFADDSVVRFMKSEPRVLRRARGYVPEPISVPTAFQSQIIGFGADIKNAFAIGRGNTVVLSQYVGDMDNESAFLASERALKHLIHLFEIQPGCIAHDMHPDYASTRLAQTWAAALDVTSIPVQHHHAHLAACLAEHHVTTPAVGIILDGTGWGPDGTIWGGEILYGGLDTFERAAHLEYARQPGNDLAARFPWRMALSWLHRTFDGECLTLDLPLLDRLRREYADSSLSMLVSPKLQEAFARTSSMGRLIDALAALIGFGVQRQYEGQAAMWLEGIMSAQPEHGYDMEIVEHGDSLVLSPQKMIRQLVEDVRIGTSANVMSRRTHEAIAAGWAYAAIRVAEQRNCSEIALSGGCLQNRFLLERTAELLERRKLRVLIPRSVPANDGGIAFGQVCIANATR